MENKRDEKYKSVFHNQNDRVSKALDAIVIHNFTALLEKTQEEVEKAIIDYKNAQNHMTHIKKRVDLLKEGKND